MLADPDKAKAARVMNALMEMDKIDIAACFSEMLFNKNEEQGLLSGRAGAHLAVRVAGRGSAFHGYKGSAARYQHKRPTSLLKIDIAASRRCSVRCPQRIDRC